MIAKIRIRIHSAWLLALFAIGGAACADPSKAPQATYEQIAMEVAGQASRLLDMMEAAGLAAGRQMGSLNEALEASRESAPKPLPGMGPWSALGPLAVKAPVSSASLCMGLMRACSARGPLDANCQCLPAKGGGFEFAAFQVQATQGLDGSRPAP